MSTQAQSQYLAIDFLHDDFEKARFCADMLAGGALQFAIARAHTSAGAPAPQIQSQYLLERRSLDAEPQRRLTLVANVQFAGDQLDPSSLQPEITRIGQETQQKDLWNFGSKIRAAKLFAHGQDMFRRLDDMEMQKIAMVVWPDEGNEYKNRKTPKQRLGQEFFSINTGRKEPHWVGHVDAWGLKDCAANNNHLAIDLASVNVLTLEKR